MEKRYKIEYLPAAKSDLLGVFEYISPRNFTAADRLLNIFDQEISKLEKLPYMGKVPDDYELAAKEYRVLVVERYFVFYVILEHDLLIEIRRILSSRQNYLQWLGESLQED